MATRDVDAALRDLSASLLPESEALGAVMAARIRADVALYRDEALVSDHELNLSCADNMRYVLGNLAGTPQVGPDSPLTTGTQRAEHGVPYAAVLEAYRVGGRFIWELLVERADPSIRDVLLRAAADIWAVTDDLSAQVTSAYRAALTDRARRDISTRAALLGTLLDGDAAVAEQLAESAAVLDLPRGARFVVVTAECPALGTEALPSIEERLRRANVRSAWRLDRDHQDGLVALRAGFDIDDLAELLADGTAGRTGISAVFSPINGAHQARREARTACTAATPGTTELVRFADQALAMLVAGAPESAEMLARSVLAPVLELDAEDRNVLLETARTWLEAAGSTSTAAKKLHLHRNSVRYRLRRLEELTGRDLSDPVQAAEVYVALESVRIWGLGSARDFPKHRDSSAPQ